MNQNNDNITVTCDDCGYLLVSTAEHKNEIVTKEQRVAIGNEVFTLVYFACPKCNKIYRVQLQDAQYYELANDLEKTKKRIRRNYGRNNGQMQLMLSRAVAAKSERLKRHAEMLNGKYTGTFTFAASENNSKDGKIIYLP